MQRMLEPFMHLVASFGGGNGIDVYKKQTCTVQGWQINTNQLAFPQIVQTHKFKTFRAFRIRAVIRWRLADPATGFKFCKTTKPGSWRNNCGTLQLLLKFVAEVPVFSLFSRRCSLILMVPCLHLKKSTKVPADFARRTIFTSQTTQFFVFRYWLRHYSPTVLSETLIQLGVPKTSCLLVGKSSKPKSQWQR